MNDVLSGSACTYHLTGAQGYPNPALSWLFNGFDT
jgi:hypothetical protein